MFAGPSYFTSAFVVEKAPGFVKNDKLLIQQQLNNNRTIILYGPLYGPFLFIIFSTGLICYTEIFST